MLTERLAWFFPWWFFFFFLPFQQGVAVAFFFLWLVWGWQRVTGQLPCLYWGQDDGSGWLTVRKCYLWVNGDTFIEPVKLTGAMSWAKTRLQDKNNTHADRDGGDRDRDMFWESAWSRNCASIKHWSLCHLGLFRRPAELFDVRAVGRVCGLNFTYPALQMGIHRKKKKKVHIENGCVDIYATLRWNLSMTLSPWTVIICWKKSSLDIGHIFLSKSTPTPLFNKFWVHDYLCDSCFYTPFYKLRVAWRLAFSPVCGATLWGK